MVTNSNRLASLLHWKGISACLRPEQSRRATAWQGVLMEPIQKITREELTVGVYERLRNNFRCFRLDSYTDMSFENERQLSKIVGTRCRWPLPNVFRNKKEELEYTFLLSTSLNTGQEISRTERHVYFLWKSTLKHEGLFYTVEATDFNINATIDHLKIGSEIAEPVEFDFEEGADIQLPEDLNALLPAIEEGYANALIASGLAAGIKPRPSPESLSGVSRGRSAGSANFRLVLGTTKQRAVEIRRR